MSSHDEMSPAELRLDHLARPNRRVEFYGDGEQISGAMLGALMTRPQGERPRKLTMKEVHVTGELDLEAGEIGFPVRFDKCVFDAPPNLEQARAAGLYFEHCKLPGLRATQLSTADSLQVKSCEVTGCVELVGAKVAGQLDLSDSVILCRAGDALKADGLEVEQDFLGTGRFLVKGMTRMIGAQIGGQFLCEGAVFRNPGEKPALELSGLIVQEHVYWTGGFTVEGAVNLNGARIDGRLSCVGARFLNHGNTAIEAVGLTVRQEAEFSTGCEVDGGLVLAGCRIGGELNFTGGEFANAGLTAIDLSRAVVALDLRCRAGTSVHGRLRLEGAEIGGSLCAEGGRFVNKTDTAIDAVGLRVQGDVRLAAIGVDGFLSEGRVLLSDAHVGGNLLCTGGRFENPQRDALTARGVHVTRDAVFEGPFASDGLVDLAGAQVGGKLDFSSARLTDRGDALRCDRVVVGQSVRFDGARADGRVRMCNAKVGVDVTFGDAVLAGVKTSLQCKGTTIGGTLRLRFAERPSGRVDLRRVTAASLADRERDWPNDARLDEFVYGSLHESAMPVDERLGWLRDHHRHVPQVYLQLAATYTKAGHRDIATKVLMANEDERRRARRSGLLGRAYRTCWWILKPTVGYGYKPFWVLWWLGGLVLIGGVIFHLLNADPANFGSARSGVDRRWFDPWLYTIDLLLPVVSLQHSDLWVPLRAARWWSLGFTLVGWVLAICLVTGVGRLFKRDDR